jgi:hypothetical protein
VRGAGQVLRALGRRVSSLTMLLHLTRHARQPYLLALTLWLPFTTLGLLPSRLPALWLPVIALTWLAVGAYYGAARRRLGRSALGGFMMAPVVMALSLGLCPSLALALWRGLRGRAGEFVRTPKSGTHERAPVDRLAWLESAIGVIYVGLAILLVLRGERLSAIAFAGWFGAGYLWVGLGSILDR